MILNPDVGISNFIRIKHVLLELSSDFAFTLILATPSSKVGHICVLLVLLVGDWSRMHDEEVLALDIFSADVQN